MAIVTDPYDSGLVGLRFPRVDADIITISHEHKDHNATDAVKGDGTPKVLRGPGEYEVKDTMVWGISTWHDGEKGAQRGENTVFVFESERLRVAHLGDLGHVLTDIQVSEIGNVDILLVPVGGIFTINPQLAVEVVNQLEPRVVIPMHYKVSGMRTGFSELSSVDEFIKAMGVEAKRQDKLDIKKENLSQDLELVILERKS